MWHDQLNLKVERIGLLARWRLDNDEQARPAPGCICGVSPLLLPPPRPRFGKRLDVAADGAVVLVRSCVDAPSRSNKLPAPAMVLGRTPSEKRLNLPNNFPPRLASTPRASGVMASNEVGGCVVEEAAVELVASRAGAEKAERSSAAPPDEIVSLLGEMLVAFPACTVEDPVSAAAIF